MGVEGGRGDLQEAAAAPPAGPWGPAARGRPWPLGGPQDALWSLASFCRIKNRHKLSSNSENIFRSTFSEKENNKNRELALGIL